ncbi:hypothetical protein COM13_19025 [Bacillus pseudomycoides]|uniref:hypothetical protein n=1 Tax=Bacillus TaxID=1386 RepID=UPI000379BBAF|nr:MULTISPECIES: hypothetical protein [Bacillus]PDX99244.1 hypothetical protein COO07_17635 [Bacillus pseudomycoides]PEK73718.1 hypothetical protein CN597_28425 [Bacillus pseudomycoides]PEN08098.1 hypothetical protein CN640_13770 [Bacillus pseudomycoides]PGB87559.1 hypothetical protein COM13_19025 [Bacillus pseudomycoides]PGS04513.1 hypothetical protein COC54_12555 [Bacillus pseudomycoides]
MSFRLTNYVDIIEEEGDVYIIHHSNGKVLKITDKMKDLLYFLQENKSELAIKEFLVSTGTENKEVQEIYEQIILTLTKYSIIKTV